MHLGRSARNAGDILRFQPVTFHVPGNVLGFLRIFRRQKITKTIINWTGIYQCSTVNVFAAPKLRVNKMGHGWTNLWHKNFFRVVLISTKTQLSINEAIKKRNSQNLSSGRNVGLVWHFSCGACFMDVAECFSVYFILRVANGGWV